MKTTKYALSSLALAIVCLVGSRVFATPPITVPLAGIAYQAPQASPLASFGSLVAFASTAGPSHVGTISFVPVDRLYCDATDYRTLDVVDIDAAGNMYGSSLYSTSTTCAGTGDWTAGAASVTAPISYDLPAGHSLAAFWQPAGAGVAVPSGSWRVE